MKYFSFSWQNLTDRKREGHYEGSILRHGRAWLRLGTYDKGLKFNWEWVFWTLRFSLGVTVDGGDEDLTFSLGLPGVQLYWSVAGIFPRKWKSWGFGRDTSIRIFDWGIWFNIWRDESGWSSKAKWWQTRAFAFHPIDFFLGRDKASHRDLEERDVQIAMLEKTYDINVKIQEWTWKRPRWPFAKKLLRARVEPKIPVPVPGKGTAEYNCGEDAVHSSTFCASTIDEAVAKFTADLLETRGKYGGQNWKPEGEKA